MRHAIDTNILVRLIVDDDSLQSERLVDLYRFKLYVPTAVILEAEWVLRKSLGLPKRVVHALLVAFIELDNVTVAEPEAVARALARHRSGMDFADALHWALSRSCASMLTFDKAFIRRAAALADLPLVREP